MVLNKKKTIDNRKHYFSDGIMSLSGCWSYISFPINMTYTKGEIAAIEALIECWSMRIINSAARSGRRKEILIAIESSDYMMAWSKNLTTKV